jgi:type I restriction enzyme S subunit
MDSGSAIPSTSRGAFYSLPVHIPPIEEQQAIAHILGTLDNKIELSRRMKETLEGIAQAIFKSWFVDFDPVHAKAAGEQPSGLAPHIADIFPGAFEESELGEIPRGWQVQALSDIVDINPSRRLAKGSQAPYLAMSGMPTQGHAPDSWIEREFGSGMKFENGDTLVARITPCLENGKTAYVDFLKDGEVGWGSTEYIVLRPKDPIPTIFAYLLARGEEFRTYAIRQMTG